MVEHPFHTENDKDEISEAAVDMECNDYKNQENDDDDEEMVNVSSVVSSSMSYDFASDDDESACLITNTDMHNNKISTRFDMDLLRESIDNGSHILNMVTGKDVVLLVGKTGVGKSLLIQAIAGKQLFTAIHVTEKYGRIVEKQVFESQDPIPGFDIGHEKKSKTRHINCYTTEIVAKNGEKRELLYLDSPGLEDTNGPEVDIATSIMMAKVASNCHTLRFVILVNYVSLLEDRGGAMRDVLKMVHNFVSDFKQNQQSFMFLFTHIDEIKDIPEGSIREARNCLLNEIIRTMNATQDSQIREVLTFMRKSLTKQYPFVDVFHPICSDTLPLVKAIEKLKTTDGKYLARNCGLTTTSRLKLSGELNNLLQNLRSFLSDDEFQDLDKAKESWKIFQLFEEYVDVHDVRMLCLEARNLFHTLIKQLRNKVGREVIQGTDFDHNFGSGNVSYVQQCLSNLESLQEVFPIEVDLEGLKAEIHKAVESYQKKLVLIDCNDGTNFDWLHQRLETLKVWSDGFEVFLPLYNEAVDFYNVFIADVSDTISSYKTLALEEFLEDQLKDFAQNLSILQSIHTNSKLQNYLNVDNAALTYESAVSGLLLALERWSEYDAKQMKVDTCNTNGLDRLIAQVNNLEILQKLTECHQLDSQLQAKTSDTWIHFADEVAKFFNNLCLQLPIQNFESAADCQKHLNILSTVYTSLKMSKLTTRDSIHRYWTAAVNSVISILKRKEGELREMTNILKDRGVTDGKKDAQLLESFMGFQFFDIYLHQKDRFVRNCSIAFARAYKDRATKVQDEVDLRLSGLPKESHDSRHDLRSLKPLLGELKQLTYLSSVLRLEELSGVGSRKKQKLIQYISKDLTDQINRDVSKWRKEVSTAGKNVTSLTKKLAHTLCEIELLGKLDLGEQNELNSMDSIIKCAIRDFNDHMSQIMEKEFMFKKKAHCLSVLEAIVNSNIDCNKLDLPDFEKSKEKARSSVKALAYNIESLVAETSQWDEIERQLKLLEKATILDKFTCSEASSRLPMLRKLMEKKETEVDDLLEQLIAAQDYHGIREFLIPSANSKDQVKKQKFDRCLTLIASSLSEIIGDIRRRLGLALLHQEDLVAVAEGITKLEQAERELGQYLTPTKSCLNLVHELNSLKSKLNQKFVALLEKMEKASRTLNYVNLGTAMIEADKYSNLIHNFLSRKSVNKYQAVNSLRIKATEEVSLQLNKFFDEQFDDKSGFLQTLSKLKAASLHVNPKLPEFDRLYQNIKISFTEKLGEFFASVKSYVSETDCFDDAIAVLSSLDRQLRNGLEDHLCSQELLINLKEQLDLWCEQRLQNERRLFGGGTTLQTVKDWKIQLEKFDPDSFVGRFRNYWYKGQSYEKMRMKITALVHEKTSLGLSAAKNCDFRLLEENIQLLELIDKHLCKYIPVARSESEKLKEVALKIFNGLCEKSKDILSCNGDRRTFQETFDNYRRLVLVIPSVIQSKESKRLFTLTNQLIFEALDRDISRLEEWKNSYDFAELKTKIEHLRSFGGFLADFGTLFHQEVKCCQHLKEDEWLAKLFELCSKYFSSNRDLSRIRHFAVLGLPPSASQKDIKKAFYALSKKYHPDKQKETDGGAQFRKIKEAYDELEKAGSVKSVKKPFDVLLERISDALRGIVQESLLNQKYQQVSTLLFRLGGLHVLDDLVNPPLESMKTISAIKELVRSHVGKIKIEIESNWSERKYRALNDNITDLKLMERRFKGYPEIFPSSWSNKIVKCIEKEIDDLGKKCRGYLQDHMIAKQSILEFRQCFLSMAFVLVELPPFRDYTKSAMSSVLEFSLGSDWGYSYLFEFGLSLQRSDENSSEDENVVAQTVLSEFSHFKEVLTMVWNEETSQKPVEDTVKEIRGQMSGTNQQLDIDEGLLLESYKTFDAEYKSLLGDYLDPESDFNVLIGKVTSLSKKLRPINCDSGWDADAKRTVPLLVAGVFAVFTIIKSGESYNRLCATENSCNLGTKLLMKPHNIQVLTLLCMFGCSSSLSDSLESQLLQIRTGEGKSIILGAAAVVLGLLGFRVRCVCYSEYLSTRDYNLFKDVFSAFHLSDLVKYSKITTLSEEMTYRKGDIRLLTERLLREQLENSAQDAALMVQADAPGWQAIASCGRKKRKAVIPRTRNQKQSSMQEILLVDEVDVFFGSEFYGQTYNQVAQIHEPEIAEILQQIWDSHKRAGKRLRLCDIQATTSYQQLLQKFSDFKFLLDNEISSMLCQVRLVDEEPYYLDKDSGRIGYKVMDTISFEATYGYRTVFAYMKEADKGNLKSKNSILANVMSMQISCGQFSYANIPPDRILGVTGTLDAMGKYEKSVLEKYGIERFMFVPSVYGKSNFRFDKAGVGLSIESSESDYFHAITDQILQVTRQKRAAIVFFNDKKRLNQFVSSSFYGKLGRQKKLLTEEMLAEEKAFVISKAATAGQITISTSVFGRGTDFFCKDERVQQNGGVHVIQAFLSAERSEEIQIQGRTARQGKEGSYQIILLEKDIQDEFGIKAGTKDRIPKADLYHHLCKVRDQRHKLHCQNIEKNLAEATKSDQETHKYFDALLAGNDRDARESFKNIYHSFKKKSMPTYMDVDLCFVVDVTGSMGPFASSVRDTIACILQGPNAILTKLQAKYPEIQFKLRVASMGYRDIDDQNLQFEEIVWQDGRHFTDNIKNTIQSINKMLACPSGGSDIAEDHLGAIHRCLNWKSKWDWTSQIKFMLLITDAPAHGMVTSSMENAPNIDNYSVRHPQGLTPDSVINKIADEGIDLFFCSFNPVATKRTEQELSLHYQNNPGNKSQRGVSVIPMVSNQAVSNQAESSIVPSAHSGSGLSNGYGKHIIFVLDESGSMRYSWSGVVVAYNQYIQKRRQNQCESDLVSVVQFDGSARTTVSLQPISQAPSDLGYRGGGTCFTPAAMNASQIALQTPSSHIPVIVFMSDGQSNDSSQAAQIFSDLNTNMQSRLNNNDLELHVIGFGGGTDSSQLRTIANSTRNGKVYSSSNTAELSNIFVNLAGNQNVVGILEKEVGKRISEAVADRLALEFLV